MIFESGADLLRLTQEHGCSMADVVLDYECTRDECSEQQVMQRLRHTLAIMRETSTRALHEPQQTMGGFIGGDAQLLYRYATNGDTVQGRDDVLGMAMAISGSEVNASMGRICAAPTAGACGILPAVLFSLEEHWKLDENALIIGLLSAAGIGVIVEHRATLSGAKGGCQAECGVASAMAAAAITQMKGESSRMALHAAAFALINIMGLICDPVAGLVELPCAYRNASGVANARCAADMALSGMECKIPFDEVVVAMHNVGRIMPYQHRETAKGGIAITPTGKMMEKSFNQNRRI